MKWDACCFVVGGRLIEIILDSSFSDVFFINLVIDLSNTSKLKMFNELVFMYIGIKIA